MTTFIVACGVISSIVCAGAGIYFLNYQDNGSIYEIFFHGIGIYFIGKAFFVGPMIFGVTRLSENNNSQ